MDAPQLMLWLFRTLNYTMFIVFTIKFFQSMSDSRLGDRRLSRAFAVLSSFAAAHALFTIVLTFAHNQTFDFCKFELVNISYIGSFAAFIHVMTVYLGASSRILRTIKNICYVNCAIHAASILSFLTVGVSLTARRGVFVTSNYILTALGSDLVPTELEKALLGINLLCVIIASVELIRIAHASQKNDRLLISGIMVNIVANINEVAIVFVDNPYIMPMLSISYLLEGSRLARESRRRSDLRVSELEGDILRVTKVAEIGYIAGNISHDIRNPLAVVEMSCERLESVVTQNDINREMVLSLLEKIRRSSKKAIKISNNYLKLISASELPVECSPATIVETALELASRRLANAGSPQIRTNINAGPVMILENDLVYCLVNLIVNAADAIASLPEKWISIEIHKKGQIMEVRVSDSGNGIPEHIRRNLFVRQFTSKGQGHGTGLGLSIIKSLTEKSGGSVHIDTTSKNTTFVIEWPV